MMVHLSNPEPEAVQPLSLRARSRRVLRKNALADYGEGSTEGLRKLSIDRSKTVQRLS
jgi:hypothetical protein